MWQLWGIATATCAVAAAWCAGTSQSGHTDEASAARAPQHVSCSSSVFHRGWPPRPERSFLQPIFGTAFVPPRFEARDMIAQAHQGRWRHFLKAPVFLRDGSPAITISIARQARDKAGITWGSSTITYSLRFTSCPAATAGSAGWAGGFYFRPATLCLPVLVTSQDKTKHLTIGIGRRC